MSCKDRKIVRSPLGDERRKIFRDDLDMEDFISISMDMN